jgi:hypothetical protein
MAAPGYEPLASGRVNDGFGSNLPVRRGGKVSNRRILVTARRPGEGPLTEPTAGAQSWPRERVLMPHSCRSQSLSRSAQLGGFRTFAGLPRATR